MNYRLERALAAHCGAVMLGKKSAALFSLEMNETEMRNAIEALARNEVRVVILRRTGGRVLMLAYHPRVLMRVLSEKQVCEALAKDGYPAGCGLSATLRHLKERICESGGFPHEIGFFLGYPPEDVMGFIKYRGRRCKHCGLWKVYGDVEKAKALHEEFEACRRMSCAYIEAGGRLRSMREKVVQAG